jgi:mono/diheme cytochrome c family protein
MRPDDKPASEASLKDRDVLEVHRAALREPPDPGEGRERGPWWLWAGAIIAIFFGGYYLGRYGGSFFKNAIHIGYIEPEKYADVTPARIDPQAPARPESVGATLYAGRCVSCHQSSGLGMPSAFPPLANSDWVTGDPETVIRVIAHGLTGPITIRGQTYNGVMPAWKDSMSAREIAEVATYIRTSWGNQASIVSESLVQKVLQEPGPQGANWTAPELLRLRK